MLREVLLCELQVIDALPAPTESNSVLADPEEGDSLAVDKNRLWGYPAAYGNAVGALGPPVT